MNLKIVLMNVMAVITGVASFEMLDLCLKIVLSIVAIISFIFAIYLKILEIKKIKKPKKK